MRALILLLVLMPFMAACGGGAGRYIIEPPNFEGASVETDVDDDGEIFAQVDATFSWFGIEGQLSVALDTDEAWVRICYQADPNSGEEDPLCYEVPVEAWEEGEPPAIEVVPLPSIVVIDTPSEGSEE